MATATVPTVPPVPGRRAPMPTGFPLVGQPIQLSRDRLGYLAKLAREHGDAVRFRMGPVSVQYLFNSPDHAKYVLAENAANYHKGIGLSHAKRALGEGLLTADGELWRTHRKVIQPAFGQKRIGNAAGDIIEVAGRLVERWRRLDPDQPIDVVEEMTRFTLAVLGRMVLGGELGEHEAIGRAFAVVQDQAMFEMATLNAVPHWLPLPRNRRFRTARAQLETLVDAMIDERAGAGDAADADRDVLARLMELYRDEPDDALRRRRLRDELVTLLLAGHETTSSTLGWTWYVMSQHPRVADRVRDEARAVLGDRTPTFEDLHGLRYTTMVVEEAMRLYPPVWLLPRRALADDEIGGYHVPAGSGVLISPYTLHRNPAVWEDPETFDPERFAPENTTGRRRYSYIPFGGGPRVCVGSNLGMAEAVLVTAMVARELRLQLAEGYRVVPEARLSLQVAGGLPMTVRPA
jgi:enediyne biosynthesis protein E7